MAGVQEEIRQTRPFASLEEEAFLALQLTADRLQWQAAEVMKPHAVSPTQYNALRILRGAGAKGLPCREIGARMINRDPDITRLLDRLERRGLVRRSRDQKDRRVIMAYIAPAGLQLLQGLDQPMAEFQRRLLGRLGERRLKSLIKFLELARKSVG